MLELGWVKVDTLKTTGTITMNPVATSDTVWVLPTQTTGEYFIFENRAAVESDTAQMNPAYSSRRQVARALRLAHRPEPHQPRLLQQHDQHRGHPGRRAGAGRRAATSSGSRRRTTTAATWVTPSRAPPTRPPSTAPPRPASGPTPARSSPAGSTRSASAATRRCSSGSAERTCCRSPSSAPAPARSSRPCPGNTADGVGVTPGTVVTLAPIPSPNHRFAGWGGDTTTTDSVLVLTMDRNWALTAQFSFTAVFTHRGGRHRPPRRGRALRGPARPPRRGRQQQRHLRPRRLPRLARPDGAGRAARTDGPADGGRRPDDGARAEGSDPMTSILKRGTALVASCWWASRLRRRRRRRATPVAGALRVVVTSPNTDDGAVMFQVTGVVDSVVGPGRPHALPERARPERHPRHRDRQHQLGQQPAHAVRGGRQQGVVHRHAGPAGGRARPRTRSAPPARTA